MKLETQYNNMGYWTYIFSKLYIFKCIVNRVDCAVSGTVLSNLKCYRISTCLI